MNHVHVHHSALNIAAHSPPTASSQAAGSAALARLEAKEHKTHGVPSTKRPSSVSSSTSGQAQAMKKECTQPSVKVHQWYSG